MAHDEELAEQVRELLGAEADFEEKKMFGGVGFMVDGNLAVAASGQGGLLVRVDPEEAPALLAEPGAEAMEMRGREMAGWIRVDRSGLDERRALETWVERGTGRARSLASQ